MKPSTWAQEVFNLALTRGIDLRLFDLPSDGYGLVADERPATSAGYPPSPNDDAAPTRDGPL